jgi:hypothetical protein
MIVGAMREAINGVLVERLRDMPQRETVVAVVMAGFAQVRKKSVPDLKARLTEMEKRVRQMAESIEIGFVNDRLVVKVVGSSESLMKDLRRGTDWYEPWPQVDEVVFAAVLVDPTK